MGIIDVTAVISTKDRYFDTLPMCIASIVNQTYLPKYLLIYDDGEQIDLRDYPLYQNLFQHLYRKDIDWEIKFGDKKGQVHNHQKAIEDAKTEWIWRIDDDEIAEPTALEILVSNIEEGVGAIAGGVFDVTKTPLHLPPNTPLNTIDTVRTSPNIQWFKMKEKTDVAEHLYSSFLFRKEAAKHGYCLDLSPAGHREKTLLTYQMKRNGWKLIVDTSSVTWHHRSPNGGIRSYEDSSYWEHDEEIFNKKMEIWNSELGDYKVIMLDCGMGDHIAFLMVLPEIIKKYKKVCLSVHWGDPFENSNVKLIGIDEGKKILGENHEKHSIYKWMWDHNWKGRLKDAFREMWL